MNESLDQKSTKSKLTGSRAGRVKVRLLKTYYGNILKDMRIICITGTTGKSVVAQMKLKLEVFINSLAIPGKPAPTIALLLPLQVLSKRTSSISSQFISPLSPTMSHPNFLTLRQKNMLQPKILFSTSSLNLSS